MSPVTGIGPTREDTYTVTVTVYRPSDPDIPIIKGVWDTMTGGQIDSEETLYNPGGMEMPVTLGGRKTVENVTVSRLYRLGRDHIAAQALIDAVGRANMTVSKQPMMISGQVPSDQGPIVYTGILKRCSFPDHNSESSDAGMIELEMTVEGYPKA